MPNPNISTQDWYYHAPSKNSTKSEPQEPPPPSQIPGLSNVIELPDEMEERRFRRKWIRDTDSKYIQLAKGGGRKNLLTYKDPPQDPNTAVGYPRVDWFDHYYPEQGIPEPPPLEETRSSKKMQPRTQAHRVLPEWYVHDLHDEKESQDENFGASNNRSKKNVISFDNMSAWERDAKDDEMASGNRVRLPKLHSNKQTKNIPVYDAQAFPKRMARHTNMAGDGPVDFRHLMSMGYQKDWFHEQNSKHDAERKKKQMERLTQDEKRTTQIRDAIEMRRPKNNATQDEDRQMFKLSRFQKIQPRVESFRT